MHSLVISKKFLGTLDPRRLSTSRSSAVFGDSKCLDDAFSKIHGLSDSNTDPLLVARGFKSETYSAFSYESLSEQMARSSGNLGNHEKDLLLLYLYRRIGIPCAFALSTSETYPLERSLTDLNPSSVVYRSSEGKIQIASSSLVASDLPALEILSDSALFALVLSNFVDANLFSRLRDEVQSKGKFTLVSAQEIGHIVFDISALWPAHEAKIELNGKYQSSVRALIERKIETLDFCRDELDYLSVFVDIESTLPNNKLPKKKTLADLEFLVDVIGSHVHDRSTCHD